MNTTDRYEHRGRTRAGVLALGGSGVAFAAYPAVRPYPDTAAAWASPAWTVGHLLAVGGFVALVAGTGALWSTLRGTRGEPAGFAALVATGLGVGLTLPYYGAEVFGLHVLGRWVGERGDPGLAAMADQIRYAPAAAVVFASGLVLVAVGAVLTAVALGRGGSPAARAGLLLAAGFVLFLPQFFAPPSLRIAHGLLLALACLWVAARSWSATRVAAGVAARPGEPVPTS